MGSPLLFAMVVALLAPSLALGQAGSDVEEDLAGNAGCASTAQCLSIATSPDVHAERRYWAKQYLDAHPAPFVVEGLAPLLFSDLGKLRRLAWWHAGSNKEDWKPALPALMQALPGNPDEAYVVADIGGPEAWGGLLLHASQSAEARSFAYALKRIDGERALAFGFAVVEGEVAVADPEGVISGIFGEYYVSDDADAVNRRLLSLLAAGSSAEVRRRAAIAHAVAHSVMRDMPAELRTIYDTAPGAVRATLRDCWRELGTARERAGNLDALFERDEMAGLLEAEKIGTAARAQSGRVLALMESPDSRTRLFAQAALHAIDPATWRRKRAALLASPDISTSLTARDLEPDANKRVIERAARESWYPALKEAFEARSREQAETAAMDRWLELAIAARERGEEPPPRPETASDDELLLVISNDATYAEPIARACPGEGVPLRRQPDTLWHSDELLYQAATHADTATWHLSAALSTEDGWFVGEDLGEFGGRIAFNPHGRGVAGSFTTTAEPLLLFEFDRTVLYIAGGSERSSKGVFAELGRVITTAGGTKAESLLTLPAPPTDAIVRQGRLLLALEGNGWVDLTHPKAPRWLGCGAEPPR